MFFEKKVDLRSNIGRGVQLRVGCIHSLIKTNPSRGASPWLGGSSCWFLSTPSRGIQECLAGVLLDVSRQKGGNHESRGSKTFGAMALGRNH